MKKTALGLTIIEILVTITVLAVLSFPLYLSYTRTQAKQSLRSSAEQLADSLRRAHVFAREAKDKKSWGVASEGPNSYKLIAGNPTATWTTEKVTSLESWVNFPQEFVVWFQIGSGDADEKETVKIQNTYGQYLEVTVGKSGIVEVSSP